jgi:predicted dehydrogenase
MSILIYKTKQIVVFGVGSIGERHIKNLWSLGFKNITVFRQRNLPLRDLNGIKIKTISTWKEFVINKPFAAIICTPTSQHLEQTLKCAELGVHCLIEKPLSNDLKYFSQLREVVKKNNVFIYIGYMMRFHPLILKIKKIIDEKTYGNLIYLSSKWGEYLPEWHPWENYKESYAAKKELGGGVALTLSHDIDMANYLIKTKVIKHWILKNFNSNLGIEVETGADILVEYEDKITANIQLNFHEKNKERFLKLIFDEASVNFNFFNSELIVLDKNGKAQVLEDKNFNRNDLFVNQLEFFFSKVRDFKTQESIKNIDSSELIIKMCNNEL